MAEFGLQNDVSIMLIPGTKCHWRNNFEQVIPLLEKQYPIAYKYMHNAYVPKWVKKLMIKFKGELYTKAALKMMGIGGVDMSFVTIESCFNQDYYDAVTPLQNHIAVEGTQVHIFYALKMGKKYEKRYLQHFVNPDIRKHNYEHEELLMCYPEKWVGEVKACLL